MVARGYWTSLWPGAYYNASSENASTPHPRHWSYYGNPMGDRGYDPTFESYYYMVPKQAAAVGDTCPPGYFRNMSSPDPSLRKGAMVIATETVKPCQLCPFGTYKPNAGEARDLCRPCDWASSFSAPDRRTCFCYRLDGGSTKYQVTHIHVMQMHNPPSIMNLTPVCLWSWALVSPKFDSWATLPLVLALALLITFNRLKKLNAETSPPPRLSPTGSVLRPQHRPLHQHHVGRHPLGRGPYRVGLDTARRVPL